VAADTLALVGSLKGVTRLEAQDYDVFSRWAETSRLGKLRVAARCAARNPQEILADGHCIRLPDVM